jgi:hypothetical protein
MMLIKLLVVFIVMLLLLLLVLLCSSSAFRRRVPATLLAEQSGRRQLGDPPGGLQQALQARAADSHDGCLLPLPPQRTLQQPGRALGRIKTRRRHGGMRKRYGSVDLNTQRMIVGGIRVAFPYSGFLSAFNQGSKCLSLLSSPAPEVVFAKRERAWLRFF